MRPQILNVIDQAIQKEFDSNKRVLSFDEYLVLLRDQPELQLRSSAQYLQDVMDFFGKTPLKSPYQDANKTPLYRFHLFDQNLDWTTRKVVSQESAQNQIYRALKNFQRQGVNNKLLLLHGPNGSAKTSLIHSLMVASEKYSHESKGAVYSFNWVFPVDKITKSGIGIHTYSQPKESMQTYAKLVDEDVLTRIPCDLKDHPFLILPVDQRRAFLEKLIGADKVETLWKALPHYLTKGDLCHRCKEIAESLLSANGGDFKKVLMHVQVERFFYSRRYRKGLVTVEPQLHVDAQYHQLSLNRNLNSLPPALQRLNLFTLSGDLIDASRGIVEYSDLLKRPIDSFKYLLIACETGAVNVGSTIAYLDTVMLGSSNEFQMDAFKEFPDFTSFKARIELIRVPYLLSVSDEEEIYKPDLEQISNEKHVTPHTSWSLALWSVLTRLKKPNSINYPPNVSTMIANLTPLEKAKLYDTGEIPNGLPPEDKKLLRSSIKKLKEEYLNIPYYEGRMGASAREVKSILLNAAQNPEFTCLSPLSVFIEMEEFVKRVSEYEFLKQDVKDGYHDATEFIHLVRNEYLAKTDREVRDSLGLYDSTQWEDFLKKYIQHISLVLKKEKVKNPVTGRLEDPDFSLISEFEKIIETSTELPAQEAFRQNIISQVGAWSLDHPSEPVIYAKVFPEFWNKLEKHYFESQKNLLTKMHLALTLYDKNQAHLHEEGTKLAQRTIENMKSKHGYCENCAKEVILFLLRQRY